MNPLTTYLPTYLPTPLKVPLPLLYIPLGAPPGTLHDAQDVGSRSFTAGKIPWLNSKLPVAGSSNTSFVPLRITRVSHIALVELVSQPNMTSLGNATITIERDYFDTLVRRYVARSSWSSRLQLPSTNQLSGSVGRGS